jgi:hypothetical protein
MAAGGKRQPGRCAVRKASGSTHDQALRDYLARQSIVAVSVFSPHDDDELDEKARAGHFDRVIFVDVESLLDCAWKGYIPYRQWRKAGATVDLVMSPAEASHDPSGWIESICTGVEIVRRRDRRRQTVGAVVLSIVALVAMAALLFSSSISITK